MLKANEGDLEGQFGKGRARTSMMPKMMMSPNVTVSMQIWVKDVKSVQIDLA